MSVVILLVTDVAVVFGLFFYWLPLLIGFFGTATLILKASLVCTCLILGYCFTEPACD